MQCKSAPSDVLEALALLKQSSVCDALVRGREIQKLNEPAQYSAQLLYNCAYHVLYELKKTKRVYNLYGSNKYSRQRNFETYKQLFASGQFCRNSPTFFRFSSLLLSIKTNFQLHFFHRVACDNPQKFSSSIDSIFIDKIERTRNQNPFFLTRWTHNASTKQRKDKEVLGQAYVPKGTTMTTIFVRPYARTSGWISRV